MGAILDLTDVHVKIEQAYVLQGVSFSVPEGELVALLGRNGAGKTTTLESILGLCPPFEGEVEFKGESLIGIPPFKIAQKGIGYSPDSARIFSELTVTENLKMGLLHHDGPKNFKAAYELFPFLEEHKENLGKSLSGGEQKLLALARAMVDETLDLLLIDEPTEGLSPENTQKVYTALEEVKDRASILLVADDLELAKEFAEEYVILSSGADQESGDIDELIRNPDIAEKYLSTGVRNGETK
ncbi:ATP-binding cassette domain-containing protein [Candidatus Bipolaricaulota bacterium]|nr:ATP-binding cassette domain-containing protein [Candidatus Bipolaricaulota bacterium]